MAIDARTSFRTCLCILSIAIAPLAASAADLARHELLVSNAGLSPAHQLLANSSGELFVVSLDYSGPGRIRVHRILPGGIRGEEIELPSDVFDPMPLGKHFLANRSLPASPGGNPRARLVLLDGVSLESERALLESDTRPIHVRTAMDGSAAYAVAEAGLRFVLHSFDSEGRERWQTEFARARFLGLAALPRGVAIQYQAWREDGITPSGFEVAILGDDARLRFKTPIAPEGMFGPATLVFQPPNILAGLYQTGMSWRAWRIDVGTGRYLGVTTLAPETKAHATDAGVVLYGNLADQPYVALLRTDMSPVWTRRYPIHAQFGGKLIDATITRNGQLAMLGQYSVPDARHHAMRDVHLVLLTTDADRPPATPPCLDVDVIELIERRQRMARENIYEISAARAPSGPLAYGENPPCALPSEGDYLRFVRELDAAVGRAGAEFLGPSGETNPYELRVMLHVRDITVPYQLLSYQAGSIALDATRNSVGYAVDASAAQEMKEHIDKVYLPHMRRQAKLLEKFHELTGAFLEITSWDPKTSPTVAFTNLESSVRTIVAEVEAIPKERLRKVAGSRDWKRYAPRLTLDTFGERPLSQIPATVREYYDSAAVR